MIQLFPENPDILAYDLAHVAGVAERVAAGLRPDGQAVRLLPDRDFRDCPGRRVDVVDDIVVAPGQPQLFAVGADIAHVGAAAARDRPGFFDRPCGKIDDRDAA